MDIARRSTALLLLTALVSLTSPAWAQRSEMARELARVTAVQVVFEKVDSNALIFGVDSSALRRMVGPVCTAPAFASSPRPRPPALH